MKPNYTYTYYDHYQAKTAAQEERHWWAEIPSSDRKWFLEAIGSYNPTEALENWIDGEVVDPEPPEFDPALLHAAIQKLTPKQQTILKLTQAGLTQREIGRRLGINQSGVCLALKGQLVHSGHYKGNYWGGIYSKLKKIMEGTWGKHYVVKTTPKGRHRVKIGGKQRTFDTLTEAEQWVKEQRK